MKGSRVKTRTGRDHVTITVTDKTGSTWEEKGVQFITNQIKVG